MLTDSVSQFETNDASHIPKSLQKLINDIHKAQGKKSKNPPLNITLGKKQKINVATKKKTKVIKNQGIIEKADHEKEEREERCSKNSVQILDQRTITDFYHSVKSRRNTSNFSHLDENSENIGKQDYIEIDNDNSFQNNENHRTGDQIMVSNNQTNSVTKFQNTEYINHLNSRNFADYGNFDNSSVPKENCSSDDFQIDAAKNWKTFNDIVISGDNFDLPERRQKRLVSNIFYKNKSAYSRTNIDPFEVKRNGGPSGKTQNASTSENEYVSGNPISNDWITAVKNDQEQMKNLLQQVKSVNNVISKARQEIMKFCGNDYN